MKYSFKSDNMDKIKNLPKDSIQKTKLHSNEKKMK